MKEIDGVKKPEVGDVWEKNDKGRKIYIYRVNDWCVDIIYLKFDELITSQIFTERLQEDYVYIGKSNVNINDLFEVQNEK